MEPSLLQIIWHENLELNLACQYIFPKKKLESRTDSAFLPTDFDYYSDISEQAMKIIEGYADVFEYVGRDEAYLDVTKKTDGNFKKSSHLAQQIKNAIREKVKNCSEKDELEKILEDYIERENLKH